MSQYFTGHWFDIVDVDLSDIKYLHISNAIIVVIFFSY